MTANCTATPHDSSWIFASLYLLLFIASLLLNCTAAWIFIQIRIRKKTFALYLCNMVAADLLMTLSLSVTVANEAGMAPWWLHVISCRYTAVLFYCCMYANILFLGLVALDRYLNIVRPFRGTCGNCLYSYSFTQAMAALVWLFMLGLSIPNTVLTDQEPSPETAQWCPCLKSEMGILWHKAVIYVNTVIFFTVLVTLLGSYICIYRQICLSSTRFVAVGAESRQKPTAKHNILAVVVVFFLCFVPYHLCRIPFTWSQTSHHYSSDMNGKLLKGKKVTSFLSACNVCLDPIIYLFMCKSFKSKLVEMLWGPCKPSSPASSTTTGKQTVVLRMKDFSPQN